MSNLEYVQTVPPQGYFEFLALLKTQGSTSLTQVRYGRKSLTTKIKKPVLMPEDFTERHLKLLERVSLE
ncbi:MAG: hypothetical protein QXN90_06480 [Zestosphaera sp.]